MGSMPGYGSSSCFEFLSIFNIKEEMHRANADFYWRDLEGPAFFVGLCVLQLYTYLHVTAYTYLPVNCFKIVNSQYTVKYLLRFNTQTHDIQIYPYLFIVTCIAVSMQRP
jgi:hypothetical protein